METVFRKWWVILLQGIFLIVLGFLFLGNPVKTLAAVSWWIGFLTLAAGLMGVIGHFTTPKEERDNGVFWWSLLTLLFGVLLIAKLGLTMKAVTVLFGIWMLMTGWWFTMTGWDRRHGGNGWIMLIIGILSIIAGFAIIFNIGIGAIWISTLLGLQALMAGISLIVLALAKRRVVHHVKDHIAHSH